MTDTNRIMIALDFSTEEEVWQLLHRLEGEQLYVKVGMELFYSLGASFIYKLKESGHQIFLDLKLHDIPNTVGKAMKAIAKLNVDMINVHASGGSAMLHRAMDGLESGTPMGQTRPTCIAVTHLTSTSEAVMNNELKINGTMEDVVVHYAKLAKSSGLDGVVSSPLEVPAIKKACSTNFLTVTPGIRLATDERNDQTRITTPKQARRLGSDYIVVGRSITASEDPLSAYIKIKKEWNDVR